MADTCKVKKMPDIAFEQANPAEFAKTIFRGWQTSAQAVEGGNLEHRPQPPVANPRFTASRVRRH
jgi:hypothetical protein